MARMAKTFSAIQGVSEQLCFTGAKQTKFSLHFVKATSITNPTKELDTLQQETPAPTSDDMKMFVHEAETECG